MKGRHDHHWGTQPQGSDTALGTYKIRNPQSRCSPLWARHHLPRKKCFTHSVFQPRLAPVSKALIRLPVNRAWLLAPCTTAENNSREQVPASPARGSGSGLPVLTASSRAPHPLLNGTEGGKEAEAAQASHRPLRRPGVHGQWPPLARRYLGGESAHRSLTESSPLRPWRWSPRRIGGAPQSSSPPAGCRRRRAERRPGSISPPPPSSPPQPPAAGRARASLSLAGGKRRAGEERSHWQMGRD